MNDLERRIRELQQASKASPDGLVWTEDENKRLNALCRTLLATPAGDELMAYLRSITVDRIMPPTASDAELRMQEGMRRLVGILDQRRRAEK